MLRNAIKFCTFALASALFLLAGAEHALAEKRIALIVGNSSYANVPRLKNPGNDGPDLATALTSIGFEVIVRMDASKNDFDRALAEFSRRSQNADVALVYYAGHGVQYQGSNYLLPVDIEVQDIADVRFQALDTTRVQESFESTRGVKILILDACRDNPFGKQQVASRAMGSIGLAHISSLNGMIVVYATASNQVALDGTGRNSPFATALIKRVKEPGLEVVNLFKKVASDVSDETRGFQRPEITSNVIGDFYINPSESDRMAWERIRTSQNSADFQNFITKFPTSDLALAAQYRLDMFERARMANEDRRRDAARASGEKAEAIRQDQTRAEIERKERERLESEQRVAAEKQKTDDAQRREAARIAADAQRKESDRLDAEKRLAAEKQRFEDNQRREAALAAERADKSQKDEARRIDEDRKRVALLEQKDLEKRQADLEQRRIADVCDSESAELRNLVTGKQVDAIQAFRARAKCPTIGVTADREFKQLRAALAQACDVDRKALGAKRDDLTGLQSASEIMTCDTVRGEAHERIARLIDDRRRIETACADEGQQLKGFDTGALDATQQLSTFRGKAACPAVQTKIDVALADVRQRTRDTQTELARLGCYNGKATGKLDDATQASMTLYLTKKGSGAQARLTDEFVSELKIQNLRVCPEAIPAVATAPERSEKPAVKKAIREEEEEAKPARKSKPARAAREEIEEPAPRARRKAVAVREEPPPRRVRERIAPPVVRERPAPVARRAPAPAPAPVAQRAPSGGGGGGGRISIQGAGF